MEVCDNVKGSAPGVIAKSSSAKSFPNTLKLLFLNSIKALFAVAVKV